MLGNFCIAILYYKYHHTPKIYVLQVYNVTTVYEPMKKITILKF